jgi:predicted nucleotidyltransferase
MPQDEPRRTLDALRAFFSEPPPGTAAVYVFGSVARGTASSRSDVDVGILFDTHPPRTLDGLSLDLRDRIHDTIGRPVDLVVLNLAPADLVHRVLRDGVLVCDRHPAARIAFEVQRRNEYFDLEPMRQRYRRAAITEVVSP